VSIADELERLQSLHDKGALSDEEYVRAKAAALEGSAISRTGSHGFLQQLARSRTDRVLGGVCGGLGKNTDLPSWAWRLIFCLTLLYFGAGLLIYVLLWIFLPQER
jgi:phage shock protein PspC (stress-responsive transcriptional regulator)